MTHPRRALCTLVAGLAVCLASGSVSSAQRETDGKKPSLSLKATPPIGFSPLRVRVVVDVRGGDDDFADLYCPELEWDWGDGTASESSEDCEPYQAGKSTIRRRYSAEHVFRQSGSFRVAFRMKQRGKVVAISSANVQVRAGIREDFGS